MEENRDWEPLPPEQLGLHPGEFEPGMLSAEVVIEPADEPSAKLEPAAVEAPHELARRRALVKAAFAAMQARAHAEPREDSLITSMLERDRRQRRRSAAAKSERLLGCELAVSAVTADDVPLPVEYGEGRDGRDLREDEAWFHELPEHERRRLAEAWTHKREGNCKASRWNPRKLRRAMAQGFLMMLLAALFTSMLGVAAAKLAAFVVLGTLGAGASQVCGGGRFAYATMGMLVFFATFARETVASPFLFYGAILTAGLLGTLGMENEMRRSGGFDEEQGPAR